MISSKILFSRTIISVRGVVWRWWFDAGNAWDTVLLPVHESWRMCINVTGNPGTRLPH